MAEQAAPVIAGIAAGIAFVVLFSFFAGSDILPLQRNYGDVVITLERTVCYGTCPAYSLMIFGNGTVVYEGQRYVAVAGRHTSSIPQQEVKELVNHMHKAGYFSMQDVYPCQCGDTPTVTTSVQLGGVFKKVVDYDYLHERLQSLEDRIDETAGSAKWVECSEGEQELPDGGCYEIVR